VLKSEGYCLGLGTWYLGLGLEGYCLGLLGLETWCLGLGLAVTVLGPISALWCEYAVDLPGRVIMDSSAVGFLQLAV